MRMFVCNIYLITLIYAWSPLHFTWAVFMYGPMMLVHRAILRQLNEILFYHWSWFLGFPWKLPTSMPTNSNRFPCEATIRKVTFNIQTTNTVQPMPNQHILYKFQTQEIHPTKLSQAASYRHFNMESGRHRDPKGESNMLSSSNLLHAFCIQIPAIHWNVSWCLLRQRSSLGICSLDSITLSDLQTPFH